MTEKSPPDPDVSIIIPAWRAALTLGPSVASAMEQTGVSVEVVIVDDASPDGTYDVGLDLARGDTRVRVFRDDANRGPGAARNIALNHARGTWVAVLDADDRFEPSRLAGMIALAVKEGADVVLGNLCEVDHENGTANRPFLSDPAKPGLLSANAFVQGNLYAVGARTLGYLKPLFRKSFLDRHDIHYDPRLRNGEDYHFVMACYAAGAKVWFSPDPGYIYTRRPGSISHRADPQHLAALLRADIALAERPGLLASLKPLLRRRQRETADLLAAETAMRALKSRKVGTALCVLIRRPSAIRRFCAQLAEALRKRL